MRIFLFLKRWEFWIINNIIHYNRSCKNMVHLKKKKIKHKKIIITKWYIYRDKKIKKKYS